MHGPLAFQKIEPKFGLFQKLHFRVSREPAQFAQACETKTAPVML